MSLSAGYLHPLYAAALREFGVPVHLAQSGGQLLQRTIPGTDHAVDAINCYPLLMCRDWSQLADDLGELGQHYVSLAAVTDPFGDYDLALLRDTFQDVIYAYKDHFVIDLTRHKRDFISSHHRRYARKAKQSLTIEVCSHPPDYLDIWTRLYDNLIERHAIRGVARFSRESFATQLQVPGLVMMRAEYQGETVGIVLWYRHSDRAYYHLAAYNDTGYRLRASFALFDFAIEYFGNGDLQWLGLGAGAGVTGDADDGLSRFKRGWSTGTRTAYFCGRIFNTAQYNQFVRQRNIPPGDFFPLYRANE